MRRLFQLRSQGAFDESATLLREASQDKSFSAGQRERFSFELGNLLTEHGTQEQVCEQWRLHLATFPNSFHAQFVRHALRSCSP
jgi:hypothetical protein